MAEGGKGTYEFTRQKLHQAKIEITSAVHLSSDASLKNKININK